MTQRLSRHHWHSHQERDHLDGLLNAPRQPLVERRLGPRRGRARRPSSRLPGRQAGWLVTSRGRAVSRSESRPSVLPRAAEPASARESESAAERGQIACMATSRRPSEAKRSPTFQKQARSHFVGFTAKSRLGASQGPGLHSLLKASPILRSCSSRSRFRSVSSRSSPLVFSPLVSSRRLVSARLQGFFFV